VNDEGKPWNGQQTYAFEKRLVKSSGRTEALVRNKADVSL